MTHLNPSRSDDSVPVETVLFTSKRVDQKGKERAVRAVDSIENIPTAGTPARDSLAQRRAMGPRNSDYRPAVTVA